MKIINQPTKQPVNQTYSATSPPTNSSIHHCRSYVARVHRDPVISATPPYQMQIGRQVRCPCGSTPWGCAMANSTMTATNQNLYPPAQATPTPFGHSRALCLDTRGGWDATSQSRSHRRDAESSADLARAQPVRMSVTPFRLVRMGMAPFHLTPTHMNTHRSPVSHRALLPYFRE